MEELEVHGHVEIPFACPDCDSLNVRASLVKYYREDTEKFGVGVLCFDCARESVFDFELLRELLNRGEGMLSG